MTYRIGTRGSKLAMVQAGFVRDSLARAYPDDAFELVTISTKGDRVTDRSLAEKGASSIAACNRSPERAQHLARDYGATIIDYTDRYAVIAKSDIVISATASPHLVVEATRLSLAHPVTFLDLAAPNDVDPSIGTRPDVTLITLETIGESIRGDRDERAELLARGGMIVESCVQKTLAWS